MVDLNNLISLLAELSLGVTVKTVFSVDQAFFREHMSPDKPQGP